MRDVRFNMVTNTALKAALIWLTTHTLALLTPTLIGGMNTFLIIGSILLGILTMFMLYMVLIEFPKEVFQSCQNYYYYWQGEKEIATFQSKLQTKLKSEQLSDADKSVLQSIIDYCIDKHRKTLDLSNMGLEQVPREVYEVPKLNSLNLSHNRLTTIDPEIAQLSSLKTLNLERNSFSQIPQTLAQLSGRLASLKLSENEFRQNCPKWIETFRGPINQNGDEVPSTIEFRDCPKPFTQDLSTRQANQPFKPMINTYSNMRNPRSSSPSGIRMGATADYNWLTGKVTVKTTTTIDNSATERKINKLADRISGKQTIAMLSDLAKHPGRLQSRIKN